MRIDRLRPRGAACATAAGLAALVTLAAAPGASAEGTWGCRASSGYIGLPGQDRIEPLVANGNTRTSTTSPDRALCADDEARTTESSSPALQAPFASTTIDPDTARSPDQRVTAAAGASRALIVNGGFTLSATDIRADAAASCVGATPTFTGTSKVNDAIVNGQAVGDDPTTVEQAGNGVNGAPVGGLVRVTFNEQVKDASGLTQRAIHVELRDGAGNVTYNEVTSEARVTGASSVCTRGGGGGAGGSSGGGSGGGAGGGSGTSSASNSICPRGSTYDPGAGLCVIERTENGRTTVISVGRPNEAPSGGTVVPVDEVTGKAAKGPCVKGRGPKYVVLGTNRADKITGTNRADRIISLGGKDKVSGGRGNDCLDGGSGPDRLDGSLGSDRIYGQSGSDSLLLGAGNDKGYGGDARDRIITGFGADRVWSGAGNDVINAASAGPAAKVVCGGGFDKTRVNGNERKRTRGCERVYVTR